MNWENFDWTPIIAQQVTAALSEDLQESSDITAELIDVGSKSTARLIAREHAVVCGIAWFNQTFAQLDLNIDIHWNCQDGDAVEPNTELCSLHGNTRALLTAERTALNFLQTLSGTATTTFEWCKLLQGTSTKLLDTRKTIPGLRLAQKYAVHCGGGHNHRLGLWDAFLIKENHIASCGSIAAAVNRARHNHPDKPVEVEVENLEELSQALDAGVDIIMLDNFTTKAIQQAVTEVAGETRLEISGNITQDDLKIVAELGAHYISSGSLTKHVRAIDFSLRLD